MKKTDVETTTKLELRVVSGPCTIRCQGETIQLDSRKDAACLVLVTTCGRTILNEEIVAVTTGVPSFLRLLAFARADGAITIHSDLG